MEQFAKGFRFPRSMLNGPANARLLEALGVEIVSDRDCELEDYARAWLSQMDGVNEPRRGHGERGSGSPAGHIATEAVRRVLRRIDRERAAA